MDADGFRAKARQCREIAGRVKDARIRDALLELAREFEEHAAALDPEHGKNDQ
jgi:hypothetical protein